MYAMYTPRMYGRKVAGGDGMHAWISRTTLWPPYLRTSGSSSSFSKAACLSTRHMTNRTHASVHQADGLPTQSTEAHSALSIDLASLPLLAPPSSCQQRAVS